LDLDEIKKLLIQISEKVKFASLSDHFFSDRCCYSKVFFIHAIDKYFWFVQDLLEILFFLFRPSEVLQVNAFAVSPKIYHKVNPARLYGSFIISVDDFDKNSYQFLKEDQRRSSWRLRLLIWNEIALFVGYSVLFLITHHTDFSAKIEKSNMDQLYYKKNCVWHIRRILN
jgi:hypothetical protein